MTEHTENEWRQAAASGERPDGVPLRVYGGYLEARAALRARAFAPATRVLKWLIGYLAEQRGGRPVQDFASQIAMLREVGAVSVRIQALADDLPALNDAEQAWALLSIAEHALQRMYLRS